MSRLRSYAKFNESRTGDKTYRIVLRDQADIQAAIQLKTNIVTEKLHGRDLKIAFRSRDKSLAASKQIELNKLAQSIRDKKHINPLEIKEMKQVSHLQHQADLSKYRFEKSLRSSRY